MRTMQHINNGAAVAMGLLPDVLMCGGAGAIAYGAGMIYTPAGFIVAGFIAMAAGLLLARDEP